MITDAVLAYVHETLAFVLEESISSENLQQKCHCVPSMLLLTWMMLLDDQEQIVLNQIQESPMCCMTSRPICVESQLRVDLKQALLRDFELGRKYLAGMKATNGRLHQRRKEGTTCSRHGGVSRSSLTRHLKL